MRGKQIFLSLWTQQFVKTKNSVAIDVEFRNDWFK
jgi:hypothetical protein